MQHSSSTTTLGQGAIRFSRIAFGCEQLGGHEWGTIDEAAIQVHPGLVLTATEPGPPKYGRFWLAGLMLNVQPEAWLTVNVRPAMVSVPLRAGPVVDATPNCTVPLPVPLLPLVIVIHDALLAAVHAHSGTVATATALEPPALATENESGLMVNVQPEL